MSTVPPIRIQVTNDLPVRGEGTFVLYWCTAFRRTTSNFALQRAVELAVDLRRPLLFVEALGCRYPWASDRFHRFVIEGMAANARALAGSRVHYHPYVEPAPWAGRGLLEALAETACVVVADDTPIGFLQRMTERVSSRCDVRVERVDAGGLLPLEAAPYAFARAQDFRRHLHRWLPQHLAERPARDPASAVGAPLERIPACLDARWPAADLDALLAPEGLAALPIDHGVGPAPIRGGSVAARKVLARFAAGPLARYGTERNHPDDDAASGLSPYLHFGHIGADEVFDAVAGPHGWSPATVADRRPNGRRQGWWGLPAGPEAFLDQLVTWRELSANGAHHVPDFDRFDSLPEWARTTLEDHRADVRERIYDLDALTAAATDDPIWNAAQTQLVREGRIHNYLRMLWGKRVLGWTAEPRAAFDALVALNDRFALDGRDPNSYAGIGWVFGRHDRAWGPERPVFGKVRYMSSQNTRRKLRLRGYLERFGS